MEKYKTRHFVLECFCLKLIQWSKQNALLIHFTINFQDNKNELSSVYWQTYNFKTSFWAELKIRLIRLKMA